MTPDRPAPDPRPEAPTVPLQGEQATARLRRDRRPGPQEGRSEATSSEATNSPGTSSRRATSPDARPPHAGSPDIGPRHAGVPANGPPVDRSRQGVRVTPTRWASRVLLGALLVGILIVGGTAFRVWQVARVDDRRAVDAVVVLGAAQYSGDPSSIFAARLRHAQALYEEGIAPRIITVGGGRAGDVTTEAEAGRQYLIDRKVPENAVIAVEQGSDTLGSLQAVAARAEREGWGSVLIVSDPGHSLRARTMARDSGLEAWTSPTRSGPAVQTRETQLRYIVRETGALLYYRLTHASVDTETTGLG